MAIRVVVAEDSFIVREGIRRLLELEPEIAVVGSCGDVDSLMAAVDAERPDVVLTDIRMPPDRRDEGIRAALELRATRPELGVVVLSQYAEPAYVLSLLEGGSERRAYLLKDRIDDRAQLAGRVATHLNYSMNSANGEYNVTHPSGASAPAPAVRVVNATAGFSWGDALAGAGAMLLLVIAIGATRRVRRRGVGTVPA